MNFSNLSGAEVSAQSVADFVFEDLPGAPWVRVRIGGQLNRGYFNAVLARESKGRKRALRGRIDMATLDRNRELDRKLFPKHMDGGAWGGWVDDSTGEEVPYSPEGFAELMAQLPADLFDELRAFVNEPVNFRSADEPDLDDIEETAGN